jgi:hypothetical protein
MVSCFYCHSNVAAAYQTDPEDEDCNNKAVEDASSLDEDHVADAISEGDEAVSDGSFVGENAHMVRNVNYDQDNMLVNFTGLASYLAYCYDPPYTLSGLSKINTLHGRTRFPFNRLILRVVFLLRFRCH